MNPGDEAGHSSEDDAIEAAAATWLAEREEGYTPVQAREFEQWCRQDPRHVAAVARLEHTCAILQKLPFIQDRLRTDAAQHCSQRPRADAQDWRNAAGTLYRLKRFRLAALGIAAAVAIGAVARWQWPAAVAETQAHYATASQGYERVWLEDGSILELNADSNARVRFSSQERKVTLASGEAHFKVAADPRRPFIVRAGDVAVRAVGTAFNVRLGAEEVEVLVTQGQVSVGPTLAELPAGASSGESERNRGRPPPHERGTMGGGATLLGANERTIVPFRAVQAAPRVEKVEPAAIVQALAWQERKLQFSETPLRKVAEKFNRHNRLKLYIADPALAERPVGGTFAADNVVTFVRLLEESGDIVAERRGEWELVLRKAR
jgi:transmembrane sensor